MTETVRSLTSELAPKCGPCPLKSHCTRGAFRFLAIHRNEAARQRARDLWDTPEFAQAQRQRKKVEGLFAELKGRIGLHRLRLRRLQFVQEQFFMAATAQNIKRLVRVLEHADRRTGNGHSLVPTRTFEYSVGEGKIGGAGVRPLSYAACLSGLVVCVE